MAISGGLKVGTDTVHLSQVRRGVDILDLLAELHGAQVQVAFEQLPEEDVPQGLLQSV